MSSIYGCTMNHISKLALVSALALSLITSTAANAAITSGTTNVQMDPGAPGDYENTWSFSDIPSGASDDPFKGPHAKGDFFDDFFTFNVPDSEVITFSAQANLNHGAGAEFFAAGFYILADGTVLGTVFTPINTVEHSIGGGSFTLTSGTYELELVGMFDKRGGTYSGYFDGTPAVPEPSGWALMLAGLGAVGSLVRRRSRA